MGVKLENIHDLIYFNLKKYLNYTISITQLPHGTLSDLISYHLTEKPQDLSELHQLRDKNSSKFIFRP